MNRRWTLLLPLRTPLSLNARQHWAHKHREVAAVRRAAALLARQQRIPRCAQIAVELHYAPISRRRRDPLNLVATLKPVEDGLVDAGVVPDDTPDYVEPTMPVIDPPDSKNPRLYVVVYELASWPDKEST